MKLLTKRQQESYQTEKKLLICESKKHSKIRDRFHYAVEYRGAVHGIFYLKNIVYLETLL